MILEVERRIDYLEAFLSRRNKKVASPNGYFLFVFHILFPSSPSSTSIYYRRIGKTLGKEY